MISHPVCVREKDDYFYEQIVGRILTSTRAKDGEGHSDMLTYDTLISAKNQCAKLNRQGGVCAAIQEKQVGGESVFTLFSGTDRTPGGGTVYLVHRSADFIAWEKTIFYAFFILEELLRF